MLSQFDLQSLSKIHTFQLPQMNPYPQNKSVLILDNCAIHKSVALREVVEAKGKLVSQY